jgi:hypothetical protein
MFKAKIVLCLLGATALGAAAEFRSKPWEAIKAAGPALKQVGWLATRPSREIASSPWSVGCETIDREYTVFNQYQHYVGELGVKSARLQSGWARCEPEKGVYTFGWLDACVRGLKEQGVTPWISLSYGNPLYASEKTLGARIFTDEETMAAWCRYVEATVSCYRDDVHEWEIWNEPKQDEGPAYANLFLRTAEVIKRVQPRATLIGLSVHGFAPVVARFKYAREVFEVLKARGKLGLLDYVSYHPYTYNPDDGNAAADELAVLVRSYDPRIRMFQGESGAPSENQVYLALSNHPWTEFSQAKWHLRRMAGDRLRNLRTSVFAIIDMKYPQVLSSKGLLRSNLLNEVVYRKPAFYAVQHMVSLFDDTVVPLGELAHASGSARRMTVGGFRKDGKAMVLLWYKDRIPSDDLKWDFTDLRISGVSFEDPVYVELISGKVYEVSKGSWRVEDQAVWLQQLPVWDSVMLLAERSQITLRSGAK